MRQYNIPASTHAAILRTEAEVMHKVCIMLHQEQMETADCAFHAAAKVELILRHQRHIESLSAKRKALCREADKVYPPMED